jgi:hypothetical protein
MLKREEFFDFLQLGVLMKSFVVGFILVVGTAYALPFQTPAQGDYQCFSSAENIFDANAQNTGATLTINADGSYTFTTSSASENGSVQVTEDTTADLERVFQNGSSLSLQPSSGSAAYEGMFATDKQGGMYVFVYTNSVILRCQSSGADIAAAIRQVAQDQVAATPKTQTTTEANTTPETNSTPAVSYDEALAVVWTSGKLAVMTKEWCDAKTPELQTANAQALETWQAEQFFYEIEEKFKTLMGTSLLTLEEKMAAQREGFFSTLDSSLSDPASYCQNLLAELRNHYDLRGQFPNEYAVIETGSGESLSAEVINLPDIGDATAGGMLEAGDYTCVSEFYFSYYDGSSETSLSEYVLSFYPDMGLRIQRGDTDYEGSFYYNQATGEAGIGDDYDLQYNSGLSDVISNFFYDSDYGDTLRSFKFYRDTQNKPMFYGQNDDDASDESIVTTLCRYVGVAQRPSPAAEEAAQVEAERFKYITEPGQGLQLAEIEGIIHTGENVYTYTGLQFQEATYLLLKDGSIYKNLQVPPADLNVTDSKQYEQENWGTWQRNEQGVTVQWYGSNEWLDLGSSSLVQPAQANELLDRSYNNLTGSTIGMIGMGGVVSTYSKTITFMPDGRFDKSDYSTMGSTVTGGDFSMNTGYYSDEEGTVGGTSSSSTIGDVTSGVSVTSESTNPNPPSTTGTYTLDGYTLELRFDDGRVERSFFYFWDDEKTHVVIGGVTYSIN